TTFQVTSRSKTVEVLVTEGKVRVDDASKGHTLLAERSSDIEAAEPAALGAGEKVVISTQELQAPTRAVPVSLPAADIVKALAWQERRLEFNSTPLFEIAAEFNRHNQHQLVIADR